MEELRILSKPKLLEIYEPEKSWVTIDAVPTLPIIARIISPSIQIVSYDRIKSEDIETILSATILLEDMSPPRIYAGRATS